MTTVHDENWSDREKKIARGVYEAALADELASTLSDFKSRVAALTAPQDMWDLEQYLRERRREIDWKYDYRYSQLIRVFGLLFREGRIREEQLVGLSERKLHAIRLWAEL
jgi:hypothetical protein